MSLRKCPVVDGDELAALRRHELDVTRERARRLGALWRASALADIPVALNPRLSLTLGRLVGRRWRIELGPPRPVPSDDRSFPRRTACSPDRLVVPVARLRHRELVTHDVGLGLG